MLTEGDTAPDFALQAGNGQIKRLKDFRGKKVILYFYPRDNTSGCTREACSFNDHLKSIKTKGAVVLGVSADSVESHSRFSDKYGLKFPLLSDPGKKTIKAYGVWREKTLYGRKFMGIERSTFLINEKGKIVRIFRKVKVEGHTEEIMDGLQS